MGSQGAGVVEVGKSNRWATESLADDLKKVPNVEVGGRIVEGEVAIEVRKYTINF